MDEFDDEGDDLISNCQMSETLQQTQPDDKTWDVPVQIPEKFEFPFEPYDIQQGFMQELYKCLQQGKVGIFESPTGTGKSLSIICGALRWLKDFQEKQKVELDELLSGKHSSEQNKENEESKASNGELDWISAFKEKQEVEEKSLKVKAEVESRLKREAKLADMKKTKHASIKRKRAILEDQFNDLMKSADASVKDSLKSDLDTAGNLDDGDDVTEDDNLIVADYTSDEERKADSDDDETPDEAIHCTKIYFCSRTHSQLSQFVREVIKSPYGDDTRVVSLGSRQNLCVNEAVRKLSSLSLINDTCRDLQKKKSEKKKPGEPKRRKPAGSQGCPYYKQEPIQYYKDSVLLEVRDIEELVSLGKQVKACAYYGTRMAIPDAEIVALPYNTLLHKSTREASGIQLKNNIVVIDEAHNLLETINNVHSTQISGAQVVRAHSQLSQYESKYRSRLKAQNLMYIKQILHILNSLVKCMGGKANECPDKQVIQNAECRLWTINDFLFHSGLDNVNMFKVVKYCEKSLISRKLHGFVEKYRPEIVVAAEPENKESTTSSLSKFLQSIKSGKGEQSEAEADVGVATSDRNSEVVMSSPLMHIEGFLLALTNADKDGRIVVTKKKLLSQCSIKFLLLNPAVHFASVVQEARAVIVAGGTMQPIAEFKEQLFHAAGVHPGRVMEYSCGHVVPGEQLLPIALSSGPTGVQLDFTFQNRTKNTLLDELGRLVCNVCNVVPGGVICFFPSYDYEKLVHTRWEESGLLAKLALKKKVFREPKKANQVDQVLQNYTACIQNCCGSVTGSILFCVVGGKMSEGINFADDLGRCVMMVGMPYPNINSPELKEKMQYLNANFARDSSGQLPGQIHYENLCMKAVNQSIGRAIRHRGDYATILLLDRRYGRPSTVAKLPGWIAKHLAKTDKFGQAFSSVSKFFAGKR